MNFEWMLFRELFWAYVERISDIATIVLCVLAIIYLIKENKKIKAIIKYNNENKSYKLKI